MMELTERQWIRHIVFHPVEGFEDLRWKKAGSMLIANIIIALWFIGEILCGSFYGQQFVMTDLDKFSIVPYITRTFILFFVWTISNWSICTLFYGEGIMRKIYIYSAYALVPYISQLYIQVLLSHFLVRDEVIFIHIPEIVGIFWSALLIFTAIKAVHQFSVSKALLSILFTIAVMTVILVLMVLAVSLIQQVYSFISSVVAEIEYRIRV